MDLNNIINYDRFANVRKKTCLTHLSKTLFSDFSEGMGLIVNNQQKSVGDQFKGMNHRCMYQLEVKTPTQLNKTYPESVIYRF